MAKLVELEVEFNYRGFLGGIIYVRSENGTYYNECNEKNAWIRRRDILIISVPVENISPFLTILEAIKGGLVG